MLKRAAFGVLAVIVGLGVMMGLFSRFQRQLIFPGPAGVGPRLLRRVAAQVGASELSIATADGETIYGWHRDALRAGPRRAVLFFHGNASSVLGQVALQELLLGEGWDFVGIHYRGYPGSTGTPSEAGLHEDARAAWQWVTDGLGVDPNRVAIHGRSLGGGVAVQLAATVDPGALVMESTFTSAVEVAEDHYPFLPAARMLEHRFMTRDFATRISCPLLVAHGSADSIIDVRHGKELARLFQADQYIEVPRKDHNDALLVGAVAERYLRFLNDAIPVED